MIERLFVYGSLAPGENNAHVMADINGEWQPATLRGTMLNPDWRSTGGYPSMILATDSGSIEGLVFESKDLANHWTMLDSFEGDGYQRELSEAELQGGETVAVFVYTHRDAWNDN